MEVHPLAPDQGLPEASGPAGPRIGTFRDEPRTDREGTVHRAGHQVP